MNTQEFVNLIASAGFRPKSYSGRGMFGARCVSVNLDTNEVASFGAMVFATASPEEQPFVERLLGKYSMDSMGMGVVLYWRSMSADGVKFPDDSDDEEMD
jgi:hypothetical protein